MRKLSFTLLALTWAVAPAPAASYYPVRLDDPKAIFLTKDVVHGDGVADDTEPIQQAITGAASSPDRKVVFLPEGRYRISKPIYIWPGVRLIGYGAARPALVLGENTPGYQASENYMVFFAGSRPVAIPDHPQARTSGVGGLNLSLPLDGNPGTFYSAISNIDLEIKEGNPRAVGVRARYAQHCYMAHMDFRIGSGLAGIHDGGNEAEDLRFYGGQYGIITRKPSPGWQFTLVDASFEGQKTAAIRTHEAGLTLIHPHFRNVPAAISIDPGYTEELWITAGQMEDVTGPAIVISRENSPRLQVNIEDLACRRVPVFALFRESGKKIVGAGDSYAVKAFSHGLHYADIGARGETRTVFETAPLSALPRDKADLPDLPARETWVNVHTLGVRGDGETDDTGAIRNAIAAHATLYFPMGKYRVTGPIELNPDTVLIGLHPHATQLVLPDATPAFAGIGGPVPMLEAPRGGRNIVTGLGIYTNGINPRAVALKWMAGRESMVNDVRFLGGHGTTTWQDVYNSNHTGDPDPRRRWDAQYPSLWVTSGGGGRFVNIWTPSTFAQAGMLVSDTSTEGRVYEMSSEHHVRNEIVLRNVANWSLYSMQTEEERGEGGFAAPLEIENSNDITVANFHIYRVVSSYQPFPYAIKVAGSKNIRFRNIHCYSDSKVSFDDAIYDQTHDVHVRQREFAWLTLSGNAPPAVPKPVSPVVAPGAAVEKLAGGFFNVSGGAVNGAGDLFFVDSHWQKIYRWSAGSRRLTTVRDNPLDPYNLVFDKSGNLLVIAYAGNGTVYTFDPEAPGLDISLLSPQPSAPRPGMTPALPVGHWRLNNEFLETVPVRRPYQFISPDGSTFIPAGDDFVRGTLYYGSKLHDVLRTFGMAKAVPGKPFYVSDEEELQTYSARVDAEGTLTDVKLFADQGGEGLAVDARGNVYLAAGQIYIYSPAGKLIDTIEVPERPTGLAFGGKDGRTLYILARSSLYSIRTR